MSSCAKNEHDIEKSNTKIKKEYLEKLKVEEADLLEKLKEFERAAGDRVKVMDALHEYNDIKDATQIVLGQLADFNNATVLEMHKKYEVLDD